MASENPKAQAQASAPGPQQAPPQQPAHQPGELRRLFTDTLPHLLNYVVLVLAFGLIGFISYDSYRGLNFLTNPFYMKYQFAVCMVFLAEYLYRFLVSSHKFRFIFLAMPFLLISIPYLNLIEPHYVPGIQNVQYVLHFKSYSLPISHEMLYCLRFVPVVRGLIALVMVVTYIAEKMTTTVFASYTLVLLPIVYMSGLIFYTTERHVNEAIKNFWYALWWAGMNVTTIGCYINPVTPIGMTLALILSLLGIIMFPLFTVYFGDVIQTYSSKIKKGDLYQK